MAIILSVFTIGFKGKTVNFEQSSPCHRTTIAYFLNYGKCDDSKLEDILKQSVIDIIYHKAEVTGKLVFCIVDDTISSHTKPSSKGFAQLKMRISTIQFERETGLWASSSCRYAFL